MSASAPKRSLKLLAVLALTVAASSTRTASAASCPGDPWFFCDCARAAAQQCWVDYEICGGLFVPGCWETYSECRLESGVDQCQ